MLVVNLEKWLDLKLCKIMSCSSANNVVPVLSAFPYDLDMMAYTFCICKEIPRPADHRNRQRRKSQISLSRGFEVRDHYKSAYEGRSEKKIKVAPSKDSLSDILPFFQPSRTSASTNNLKTPHSPLPMPYSLDIIQSAHRMRCAARATSRVAP